MHEMKLHEEVLWVFAIPCVSALRGLFLFPGANDVLSINAK